MKDNRTGKRLTIALSEDAANSVEELAIAQGINQNEVIRKAIALEVYMAKAIAEGSKILIQTPDKEIREIVLR